MSVTDQDIVIELDGQEAMKQLCAINDGDCALLYIYAHTCGGHCRLADFAVHSGFDDKRVQRAKNLLIVYKLCRPAGASAPTGDGYSPAELLAAQKTDPAFRGLCDYFEQVINHPIRKSEIETIYGIYDRLNMPPDVIMLLINYCRARERLSARELEKRAYEWHDKGIVTYAAAADAVDETERQGREYRRVLSLFGITNRAPSESERKYISAWLEMGLSDELIQMAYDRTVLRTGKLQWRYLHKILADWAQKGYKSRAQVERAEGAQPERSAAASPVGETVAAAVTRMFEEKRAERERHQEAHLEELRRRSPAFAQNEVELRRLTVNKARVSLTADVEERQALEERHRLLLGHREMLLSAMGLDESYIDIPPDCPKCLDRGYIGTRMCDCFKKACAEEEQRRKRLDIE